jgi:hypothetical protein
MCAVIRLMRLAATAVICLAPLTATAASPSPSPSLDSILAKPPTADFKELTTSDIHGEFTAHAWAAGATNASPSEIEATLTHNGFIDGYGNTWTNSNQQVLIEFVMAFNGGNGAKSQLTAQEATDKADPTYVRSTTLSGISPSYGVHDYDKANTAYVDIYAFVKGNDMFGLAFVSSKDDVQAMALNQAQAQYSGAPDSTVPSSQWPENQSSNSSSGGGGTFIPIGFIVVVIVALVGFFVRRARSRGAVAGYAGTAGMAGGPAVQMSPDGKYWYDGQSWRDTSQEVPPTAQRSSDGTLWWDGRTWRPVPGTPPQQPPTS